MIFGEQYICICLVPKYYPFSLTSDLFTNNKGGNISLQRSVLGLPVKQVIQLITYKQLDTMSFLV
jgi:hypothetical protein